MDTITQLLKKEKLIFGRLKNTQNINHKEFPISFHIQCLDRLKQDNQMKIQKFDLNDSELLSLLLLMGTAYNLIQECLYCNCCNDLQQSLHECLDSALQKLPKSNAEILYRQEKNHRWEIEKIKIGQSIKIPAYFTTSKEDFENGTNIKWIITPLKNELTKAHNLFEIYNPGEICKEWQVNFERNTEFVIEKIELQESNISPNIVYISEKQ